MEPLRRLGLEVKMLAKKINNSYFRCRCWAIELSGCRGSHEIFFIVPFCIFSRIHVIRKLRHSQHCQWAGAGRFCLNLRSSLIRDFI